jgi:hypothetical protein
MKIEIIQEKFSFLRNQYNVFVDGKLNFTAKSKLISIVPTIKIYDLDNEWYCDVKQKNLNKRILMDYEVYFRNQSTYELKSESLIEHNLYTGSKKIDFYEQKKRDIGIFRKGTQVGIITKNFKKILSNDKYSILVEDGEIKPIEVLSFILAYDYHFKNDNDSLLNYDFGNVSINPIIEINENWKPKKTFYNNA